MSLNTDKIIFQPKEEIQKYVESLVEDVLKIPEEDIGVTTDLFQEQLYHTVKEQGSEKFINDYVKMMLLQKELDPNISAESEVGLPSSNSDAPSGVASSNVAFNGPATDCKLFKVNFWYNNGLNYDADAHISALNAHFSNADVDTSLYGSRKQLDTKIRFVKNNDVELHTNGSIEFDCNESLIAQPGSWTVVGTPRWALNLVTQGCFPTAQPTPAPCPHLGGIPDKEFNVYIPEFKDTQLCPYGAYAWFPSNGYPQTGLSVYKFPATDVHTITHEFGHSFQLMHVFGSCGSTNPNDCNCDDDGVSDTPLQKPSVYVTNVQWPNRHDLCNDGPSMNENWLDYSWIGSDMTKYFFTQGQNARMHAAIEVYMSDWYEWCNCETLQVVGAPPPNGNNPGPGEDPPTLIDLPMATLIGYSSRGDFFGEDVGRWRTVQTVTIQGLMYPSKINDMISEGSDLPTSANTYLGHNVSINGYAVDSSRLISLEFPASDGSVTEKHDSLAKYIATYEVYIAPTDNTMFGFAWSDLKALEEFDEDISFSRAEDNSYSITWSMNVKFAQASGGATDNCGVADSIATARSLWTTINSNAPHAIPDTAATSLRNDIPDIWDGVNTGWYNTEVIDTASHSVSFTATRKFLPLAGSTSNDVIGDGVPTETGQSSATRKHSLEITAEGIVNVTQEGDIEGMGPEDATSISATIRTGYGKRHEDARGALYAYFTTAYANCNLVYNEYKGALGLGTETASLHTQYSKKSINYDPDAGKINYSITFTNDTDFGRAGTGIFSSRITKDKESSEKGEAFNTYTEEAEYRGFLGMRSTTSNLWTGDVPNKDILYSEMGNDKTTGSAARIVSVMGLTNFKYIHPISKKISFNDQENKFTFVKKYSDDPSLTIFPQFSDATSANLSGIGNDRKLTFSDGNSAFILKTTKQIENKHGVTKKEWINPPNNPIGSEFAAFGNDIAELSTRKVTYSGQLSRMYSNEIEAFSHIRNTILNLVPYMKVDCLRGYVEVLRPLPSTFMPDSPGRAQYYYSDFYWTYKSGGQYSATLEMKYVMPIGPWADGAGQWPEVHSDNTVITQ